jgi:hypothetical protein
MSEPATPRLAARTRRRAVLAVLGAAAAAALGGGVGARLAPEDVEIVGGPPRMVIGGAHAGAAR